MPEGNMQCPTIKRYRCAICHEVKGKHNEQI